MADKKLDLIPLYDWGMFTEPRPSVIAGPCSAESEEQVLETAKGLRELGINVYRAGIWKPRTHPGCFEGAGSEGLRWMQKAKKEYGLKIATEVASEKHVFECLKFGVDLVWIGARTTSNPFLVQEIADALQMPRADVVVALESIVEPISLYEPVFSDGGDTIYVMDQISDTSSSDEVWLENIALREAMKKLNEREKKIITLRFGLGGRPERTQKEVADLMGISQSYISRLEKRIIRELKEKIGTKI